MDDAVTLHPSAFKHGLSAEDVTQAWMTGFARQARLEDDQPERYLRIGVDTKGRPVEVVALVFDQKRTLIIHAMPVRKATLDLLEGRKR
ncbi:toxin [Dermacoccus sp. 147Ba]|uniref:hypothetical protein n=1 Tax=unclassified Dermacoccus TaxID=2643059 RepID=UPI0006427E85|nr:MULTISPECIES: hypothetical protein [unclassified Dermacoccus]KLO63759.1 hypothetical protein AA983_03140 [Dermacoccus sp. PE3]QNK53100.1 toxin [Dermacoccus sp. PAMC28757]RYI21162.1 toxin [Dermacoccus sp. 147Ba]